MITEFKGEYRWLSNFWKFDTPLVYQKRLIFETAEHFYQAMKSESYSVRELISKHPSKGLKSFQKRYKVRDDWEDIKLDVMLYILRYKFSENNPNLRHKLIETGDLYIQEGNYWCDTFWGVDLRTGVGENNLGKLLMKVRGEL